MRTVRNNIIIEMVIHYLGLSDKEHLQIEAIQREINGQNFYCNKALDLF